MKIGTKAMVVITIALALAYLGTSEAMIGFGPRSILGWTDPIIPILWAYISAGLVEGVALIAFNSTLKVNKDSPTRGFGLFITALGVIFSGIMNIVDLKINDGTMAAAIDTPVGGFLHGVIKLIPLIVAVAYGTLVLIDSQFPDRGGGKQNQPFQRSSQQDSQHQLGRQFQEPALPQGNGNGNRVYGEEQKMRARLVDPRNPTPPA